MFSQPPDDSEYLQGMIIALEAQRKFLLDGLMDTLKDVPAASRLFLQASFAVRRMSKAVDKREMNKPRMMDGFNDGWSTFNGLLIDYGLDPKNARESGQ